MQLLLKPSWDYGFDGIQRFQNLEWCSSKMQMKLSSNLTYSKLIKKISQREKAKQHTSYRNNKVALTSLQSQSYLWAYVHETTTLGLCGSSLHKLYCIILIYFFP